MRLQFKILSGVRGLVLGSAVTGLVAGCGGKGEAPPSNAPNAASAPAAPARKIGEAEYKAFNEALVIEGYTVRVPGSVSGMGARIALDGAEKPNGAKVGIEINYSACDSFICPPLDLAAVKANQENMKRVLPTIALESKELVHEIFEADFGGKKVIGVYTLYMIVKKDSEGGTSKIAGNSIDLTWHDNAQLLQVKARAADWGAENQAQLAERTPRAELEAAAKLAFEAAQKALPAAK